MTGFEDASILVVGGAGFVGSNLIKTIPADGPRRATVIENFLSADLCNVPDHSALRLVAASITGERILAGLVV